MSVVSLISRCCPQFLWLFGRRCLLKLRYLRYRAISTFSTDVSYKCPCCDTRLSGFVSGNYKNRPGFINTMRYMNTPQDVLCPVCGSLPRHRILATWCINNIESLKRKHILYFALEKSMECFLRRNRILYTSADLYKISDVKLNLDNIAQPDESWDIVFCNHVLEHVPNFKKALREIHRILKPEGMLICSFPVDVNYSTLYEDVALIDNVSPETVRERIRKFGQGDHLRVFGRDSVKLLENAGFVVSVIDGGSMDAEIMPVVGPADYDSNKLFVCVKKS